MVNPSTGTNFRSIITNGCSVLIGNVTEWIPFSSVSPIRTRTGPEAGAPFFQPRGTMMVMCCFKIR